ncbi:hypothetical protein CP556_08820 [Natrinema sp. CBA1119]|uniref:hypothetical protein n=1 Tax=Natrinema sp. CBA1119 TaxID=1608465 RepID=UPI000BF894FB|nr:hypothetical protein [Natrinema sp. CBA1119]PGF16204.1 hypothetical protein CP556_08820 [Natrinema sp. CBA1119]
MTADADGLRRLADVVDALGETRIGVDSAQLLEADDTQIRGQVSVTVPVDGDLAIAGVADSQESDPQTTDNPESDSESDEVDEDAADPDGELLDHTSTEDLQLAYDEADSNISAAADRFEVGYAAVYRRMVQHGVHKTDSEDDSEEDGPSTEGDTPTSDVDSESEAEDDVALEEEAADDDAGDAGADVQEEPADPEPITVDAVDDPDDPDETELELPDGVTTANVEAAVGELETLGDVSEEIGVTRGRARTITVALGCYGDVQDLPAGGR